MELEMKILSFFRSISNTMLDNIFRLISFFGESYFAMVIVFIIFFFIDKKKGYRLAYAVLLGTTFNNAIKGLIKRPRPWVLDPTFEPAEIAKPGATGYSFPSGHTQGISTLATSVALNFRKKIIIALAIIFVLAVGFSRNFLGVHYPTDVLVGCIVGIVVSIFAYEIHRRVESSFKKQFLTYLITVVVFAPFLFIFFEKDYELMTWQKDFYVAWCMLFGLFLAYIIEAKFVQYEVSKRFIINLLRFIGCIITFAITYFGLKVLFGLSIFPQDGNSFKRVLDGVRYFFVAFSCLGLYPLIFKNILFKKEQ